MAETSGEWYIEAAVEGRQTLRRSPLRPLPFRVGRSASVELSVADPSVSTVHAEIVDTPGGLVVRDLGSRNGTYVNRVRIEGEKGLDDGDVVHFGRHECRIVRESLTPNVDSTVEITLDIEPLPARMTVGAHLLQQLLSERAVAAVFQPIVTLSDRTIVAFEALGRGNYPRLPSSPMDLFRLAAEVGRQSELSALLRDECVRAARELGGGRPLFVNTHPAEMAGDGLITSLGALRNAYPYVDLILEVHEAAVADLAHMLRLRDAMLDLGVRLAYDDFGAGQARLLELTEAPPAFLKFDMSLIRGLDQASPSRQSLVVTLVSIARDIGITCIAEGVETAGEAIACSDMSFDQAQGYYFGKPAPASAHVAGSTGGPSPALNPT